jgi:CheY-like chemotaxis protein
MPMSHAPHKPWRVLLVEDDPIIAIMLGDMLHELGCTVIGPAGSAAAALLIASERKDGAVLGVSRTEKQLFAR